MGFRIQRLEKIFVCLLILAQVFSPLSSAYAVVNTLILPADGDAQIAENAETINYGASAKLIVQSQSGPARRGDRNARSAIRFNTSAIPADATLESASLRLYLSKIPDGQRQIDVHRLTGSWLEGNGNASVNDPAVNGVTWIERQFGDNIWTSIGPWDWISKGGDYLGQVTASALTPPGTGWMTWNVLSDVSAWVTGLAPNHGWLMRDSAENAAARQLSEFASRESAQPDLTPVLEVAYLKADGAVSTDSVGAGWYGQIKATFSNTGGAGGDQIKQAIVNIPADWSDIPTNTVDYAISAPAGKSWNVTTVPAAPVGPQTLAVSSSTGTADLADGEMVEITFNVRAPWLSQVSVWDLTAVGAVGGWHPAGNKQINVFGETLQFLLGTESSLSPVNLSGVDASAAGSFQSIEVRDGRGTAAGWSLVLASTDFANSVDQAETISSTGFIIPTEPSILVVSGDSSVTAGKGSLAGPGLTVLNAASGGGAGHYRATPDLELLVPAEAIAGTYEATVTETLLSGI